mgnify:FL=1
MAEAGTVSEEQQQKIETGGLIGHFEIQRGGKGEYFRVPVWAVPDPEDVNDKRPFIVTNSNKTKTVELDLDERKNAEVRFLKSITSETSEALEQRELGRKNPPSGRHK